MPRLLTTEICSALPSVLTTIESVTEPLYFALRASSEYSGSTFTSRAGGVTPLPTLKTPPPLPPPAPLPLPFPMPLPLPFPIPPPLPNPPPPPMLPSGFPIAPVGAAQASGGAINEASIVSAGCSIVTRGGTNCFGAGFGNSAFTGGRGERDPPPPP